MFRRLLDLYYRILKYVLTTAIFIILIPVTFQILSRYIPVIPSYIWTEEVSRFCFIWIIMIGAIIGLREHTHFEIDLLPTAGFAPRVRFSLKMFVHVAVAFFALVFVVEGYQFTYDGRMQESELSGLPMMAVFVAWPIVGVSWLLFLAEQVWDEIQTYRREQSL